MNIGINIKLNLIFVNISAKAEPFEEFIKPLDNRWSGFLSMEDRKLIRHPIDHGHFQFRVKSNWKFAIENYCESYHLPWIHPDLNSYSKTACEILDINNQFRKSSLNEFFNQIEFQYSNVKFAEKYKNHISKSNYIFLVLKR